MVCKHFPMERLWLLQLCFSFINSGLLDSSVPKLILISMDGFRYDYLDRFMANQTSNFQFFIQNGVKAKYIRNVFPTVTYPNHYTLITGLYPESHGIVHNRFYDPHLLEHFWYDSRMANFDPLWFDTGAEPIYVTNHKAGSDRRSGSVLWPGGLGKVKCIGPDYIIPNADPFNETKMEERIDYIMSWFTKKDNPINLGLLYFLEPDETAHKSGPDSDAVNNLITGPLNDALGYMKKKLKAADMLESMNIIITSDHGFAAVTKIINLDNYIPASWYEENSLWHNHIVVNLIPKPGFTEKIVDKLKPLDSDLNVYRKGGPELKKLHFNDNDRIAELVLVGNEGIVIVNNATKNFTLKGMHGYRPDTVPNMHPFFIAYGPAFKKAFVSEPFDSVDIYPLMCHVLGITPAANNGSLESVKHILVEKSLFEIPMPFSITAISFLIVVGVSVTVAGVFAICTIIHARKKPRFLLPASFRGTAEGQSQQSHKLLEESDDDEF